MATSVFSSAFLSQCYIQHVVWRWGAETWDNMTVLCDMCFHLFKSCSGMKRWQWLIFQGPSLGHWCHTHFVSYSFLVGVNVFQTWLLRCRPPSEFHFILLQFALMQIHSSTNLLSTECWWNVFDSILMNEFCFINWSEKVIDFKRWITRNCFTGSH